MEEVMKIYHERIISNQDLARKNKEYMDWFTKWGLDPDQNIIKIMSGKLLIIDPIYLADIYNKNGLKERYLKKNGVVLTDFGGDVSGQVLRTRCGGIKILLVFDRVNDDGYPIFREDLIGEVNTSLIDSSNLGCDSGSYIFLDFSPKLKTLFVNELKKVSNLQFVVEMEPGLYNVGYEQWETNENNPYEAWRRNIVVWRD
jgi:hypothetical protein